MNRRLGILGLGAVMLLGLLVARNASSCPFCTAVAQTFSEEFATVDAIVIAQLDEPPPPSDGRRTQLSPHPRPHSRLPRS